MHDTLTAWEILGLGEGNCFQDYCVVPVVCHLVITARIACLFVFYFIYFGCLRQSGLKFTMCLRLALNSWPSHFHVPGSGSTSMYYHTLSWGSSALPALGSWGAGSAAWATLPSFRSLCFKLGIFILKASYILAVYLLVCRNSPCLLLRLSFLFSCW